MTTDAPATTARPLDMHVHVVGNGSSGSGCWLRTHGRFKWQAAVLVRMLGLPGSALTGDLDRLYVARLLELLRASSLHRAVILAQEQVHDVDGRARPDLGSFYVPNDYVLELARAHPELLPAVSIHPARPDALAELDRCLERGAVMLKLLPNCQNIDCSDRRYTRFWERMAESGLPLLAHTGGEFTLPVVRADYADPRRLQLPLDCGVTVIAAHCGTRSGLRDPDYFPAFVEMTRRYPRLYGDNSAFTTLNRCGRIRECCAAPLAERIVHGSDYPVPILAHRLWLQGRLDWRTFRRWQRDPNLFERDYQLKRALGFSETSFTRITSLLRPAT